MSPINILRELFSSRPDLVLPTAPPRSPPLDPDSEDEELGLSRGRAVDSALSSLASTPPPVAQTQGKWQELKGLLPLKCQVSGHCCTSETCFNKGIRTRCVSIPI